MTARAKSFRIDGGAALKGTARVPGDKSISHRAVLIAALADAPSLIRNLSPGEDVKATVRLIEALGCEVTGGAQGWTIVPKARRDGAAVSINCGNSGTTMRLGSGFLARSPRTSMLWGDASLSSRPMARVLDPLASMGAIAWSVDGHPPIVIQGGRLQGIDFTSPVASAQVKGAVLFAALGAEGETTLREPVATRAHTEEMLSAAGADVSVSGQTIRVRPSAPGALDLRVPGDPSAAAFWMVAALITPGSTARIEGIYRGPGREGVLDILGRMGAELRVEETGPNLVDIAVESAELRGTTISDPGEIAGAIDELPAVAVAAAFATGTTTIAGAQELRLKESDRVSALVAALGRMGATAEETPDGLVIEGAGPRGLRGATVDARGDHRIAMALAVAGCAATGTTTVESWDSVAVSDPAFEEQLRKMRPA